MPADDRLHAAADPDIAVGVHAYLDAAIAADLAALARHVLAVVAWQPARTGQGRGDRGVGAARDRVFGDAVGGAERAYHQVMAINRVVDTRAACEHGHANFTVLRLKRDILRRSTIGGIFTNRNESAVTAGGSNQA